MHIFGGRCPARHAEAQPLNLPTYIYLILRRRVMSTLGEVLHSAVKNRGQKVHMTAPLRGSERYLQSSGG